MGMLSVAASNASKSDCSIAFSFRDLTFFFSKFFVKLRFKTQSHRWGLQVLTTPNANANVAAQVLIVSEI